MVGGPTFLPVVVNMLQSTLLKHCIAQNYHITNELRTASRILRENNAGTYAIGLIDVEIAKFTTDTERLHALLAEEEAKEAHHAAAHDAAQPDERPRD